MNFKRQYGYNLRENGIPCIDEEKAAVVQFIFQRYKLRDSPRIIAGKLDEKGILNPSDGQKWEPATIKAILKNEKYCGDVLGQKTFKEGVIGGKVQKNTGHLPQVLVQNNHPAIISRELFYAVQEEKSAGLRQKVLQRNPPQADPAMQANMLFQSALYAENAELCTADAPGTARGKSELSGAV